MQQDYILVKRSGPLEGEVRLTGAKNAVLPIMASLLLTAGKSTLQNVPCLTDVDHMVLLLQELGAQVAFDRSQGKLTVDTSSVVGWKVSQELMKKMRASVLVLGPLLARFGQADIAMPGGCVIGTRPIDYHLKNFKKMGAELSHTFDVLSVKAAKLHARRFILDYPSVGATENILMAAVLTEGRSEIVNAALEPEVYDLIEVLQKMGARVEVTHPATIVIHGVEQLNPVEHVVMYDRLEAGALLLATAITGGKISLPDASASSMELFLMKLEEMGHDISIGAHGGVMLQATKKPQAVSFKTGPYPGFPTDLQALMMVAQAIARGHSEVVETVFENRFLHVPYLKRMGAEMEAYGQKATISGVNMLYGNDVVATDIRASCALVLAGLVAKGTTRVTGVQHWLRGYESLEQKLQQLGAHIEIKNC